MDDRGVRHLRRLYNIMENEENRIEKKTINSFSKKKSH